MVVADMTHQSRDKVLEEAYKDPKGFRTAGEEIAQSVGSLLDYTSLGRRLLRVVPDMDNLPCDKVDMFFHVPWPDASFSAFDAAQNSLFHLMLDHENTHVLNLITRAAETTHQVAKGDAANASDTFARLRFLVERNRLQATTLVLNKNDARSILPRLGVGFDAAHQPTLRAAGHQGALMGMHILTTPRVTADPVIEGTAFCLSAPEHTGSIQTRLRLTKAVDNCWTFQASFRICIENPRAVARVNFHTEKS